MVNQWIEFRIIKKSRLFDPAYYLLNNPDVRVADVDPLKHFLRNGWKEGRNPSPFFDVHFYLGHNPDVAKAGINPLLHYIRYGEKEGRLAIPGDTQVESPAILEKRAIARQGLRRILSLLELAVDPAEPLQLIRATFGKDRDDQFQDDLYKLENFFANIAAPTATPISQAAELPEVSTEPRRRKILFITSLFPSLYHGGGNRVLNFIKNLSRENDIYLLSSYNNDEDKAELITLGQYCKSLRLITDWRFGRNQDEIKEWLAGERMDIIHYEWPLSLENYDPDYGQCHIFTYMETVSLRLKLDLNRLEPLAPAWLDKFIQLAHAMRIELADAARMDARIAVTTRDGEFLRNLYPGQEYIVLNHGLNFNEFCLPDVEPEPNTLVFVGNYRHYPNVDALELFFDKIWPEVCRAVPDAHIYLVGPNAPENLARLGNNTSIIFTGGVADIRPYIQKAAIGIAPLITGAGMRGKVIDYAALRRTFVATSIATTDLIFQDGQDYFCADNPELFAQRIIALLQDRALADRMATAAYETARSRYDHRQLTDFLIRLYNHIERNPK